MQTHSLPSNPDELNDLLTETVTAAIEGNLTDTQRVVLYQVAMAVTANELHRIERASGGTVSAEVLATLQHIAHICDYSPEADTDDSDEEDSGGGLTIVS